MILFHVCVVSITSFFINRRAPVIPADNDVAVVFENLSIAPPQESTPLIEGECVG